MRSSQGAELNVKKRSGRELLEFRVNLGAHSKFVFWGNVRAFIVTIRFWGSVYYDYNEEASQ